MGNYTQTEKRAINKIASIILESTLLSPQFNEEDKQMGYDGFIEVFSSPEMKKADLLDKLQVQIRGRTITQKISNPGGSINSNPISKNELELYYRNNGVLYFLVVNPNSNRSKVFYNYLFPITIRRMLSKNSHSVKLFLLNKGKLEEFYKHCRYFIQEKNNQAQISTIPLNMPIPPSIVQTNDFIVLRGISMTGDAFEISLSGLGNSKLDKIDISCSTTDLERINEIYEPNWATYLRREGSPFLIPAYDQIQSIKIHKGPPRLKLSNIENQIFFDGYPRLKVEDSVKYIYIYESFYLELHDNSFSWKYAFNDSLKNLLISMRIIEALCNDELLINDKPFKNYSIDQRELDVAFTDIIPFKEIDEIIKIFPSLEVLKESKLKEEELMHLQNLYKAYVLGDCTSLGITEWPKLINYRIKEVSLIFLYSQIDGVLRLIDPFKNTQFHIEPKVVLIQQGLESSNKEFFTSLFATFNAQTWIYASNLNVETVVNSITTLDLLDENQQDQLSYMLLQLLEAYDKTNRKELLLISNEIAEFLYPTKFMETSIYLNCIQTFYRFHNGKLPTKIKQWLFTVLGEAQTNNNHLIECAVYILLSENEEAKKSYSQLIAEEKAQIDNYPIGRLLSPTA